MFSRGAAIAQWNSLHLPSCRPGFESQANHLSFYFIYIQICAIFVIVLWKEWKVWPIFKKKNVFLGGSPGLVVMGEDSCSEGRGFESRCHKLDGYDIFHIDLL